MTRALLIQAWSYHTARVHKDSRLDFPPNNVLGVDVLEFVKSELSMNRSFDKEDRKRWVQVSAIQEVGSRSLLVTAKAGAYGEPGEIVDRRKGSVDFVLREDHAPTADTRMLVIVPDVGLHAFAFVERSTGRGSAGLDLVGQLHSAWRERETGATWRKDWMEDPRAWLESGEFKSVEIKRYRGDSGTLSSDVENLGGFEYRAKSRRGRFFSRKLLVDIVNDSAKAHQIFGIEVEPEDKVFVEIELEKRVSKYALDNNKLPRAQIVLPDDLGDAGFVRRCLKEARDWVFPGVGLNYNPQWGERN